MNNKSKNNKTAFRWKTRDHRKSKKHRYHRQESTDGPHYNTEALGEPDSANTRHCYCGTDRGHGHTGRSTHNPCLHYKLSASCSGTWNQSSQRRPSSHKSSTSCWTPGQTQHQQRQQQQRQQQTTSSGVSSTETQPPPASSQDSDIPGYYYDATTKRYFKIQSYQMGSVAPFVTREKLASQQKESQRLVDVADLTQHKVSPSTASCRLHKTARRHKQHLLGVLESVQCGRVASGNMRTYMLHHMVSRIQPGITWDKSVPRQPSSHLGDIQNMDVNKNRDKVACVRSLTSTSSQMIQLLTVDEHQQSGPGGRRSLLRVGDPFLTCGPVHKRISSMCWAPVTGRQGQNTILYTTVCPVGSSASTVYLSDLEAEGHEQVLCELRLGKSLIWSAAWNAHEYKCAIGAERRCYLIDVATRKHRTLGTVDSDPLSQLFSPTNPYLYNGTRKGDIILHDLRAPEPRRHQLKMSQAPGVGCLRLLSDENYLMASDFSGTICTWDQRMKQIVMEYRGLVNSHWQLPFHVDETETLLTSTGSDSYTKLWSLRSGQVLRNIPPPYPVSCDSFPLSFYSTRWAHQDGSNALLLAMRTSFTFYTYKEMFQ